MPLVGPATPGSVLTLAAPPSLGRYDLLCKLGSGGMASVYLARARATAGFERLVAVKCCHPHLRDDADFAAMFLDEARLAAKIRHPNVVSTFDAGDEGALYLVMEYVEGGRITELVRAEARRSRRVPIDVALRVMVDALTGLHAAHTLRDPHDGRGLRVVHRDVSPDNVLVGVDGVARVADFGIAKAEARSITTRDGRLKGKLGYMSPEQLLKQRVDHRADVYAAGVVLWELLTGRRLFVGETDAETVNLVLSGGAPPPSSLAEGVPPELDAVVARALRDEPSARFESAAAFGEALESLRPGPASARRVGEYVLATLADSLEERRAMVRAALGGGARPVAAPPADARATFVGAVTAETTPDPAPDVSALAAPGSSAASLAAPAAGSSSPPAPSSERARAAGVGRAGVVAALSASLLLVAAGAYVLRAAGAAPEAPSRAAASPRTAPPAADPPGGATAADPARTAPALRSPDAGATADPARTAAAQVPSPARRARRPPSPPSEPHAGASARRGARRGRRPAFVPTEP